MEDVAVTAKMRNTEGGVCIQAVGMNDGLAFRHVVFEGPLICTSKILRGQFNQKFQKELCKRKVLVRGMGQ